ncbi:hypothetical protein Cfor_11115 [Coptotermes formosanus]|uniref:RING-type E3 ubiquitin transferase n=1 Tax=Coptotermes formosanus TaxID=36987 RepID=A0A6L2Q6Z4_COPFO|nr:hypothetical protein Cfor_11115 [Coptotermes formosanus]
MDVLSMTLLPELLCSACHKCLEPPGLIQMCDCGHSICGTCSSTSSRCRECNCSLFEVVNKPIEHLTRKARYPCQFHTNGCREVFVIDRIRHHEKECLHRPHRCPFAVTKYKCTWRGHLFRIRDHVMRQHTSLNREVTGKFSTSLENFGTETTWYETVTLHKQVFLVCAEVTRDRFHTCVLFVGPQGREVNYRYSIRIDQSDSETGSASGTHGTFNYLTDTHEIFRTGNCFTVDTKYMKKCLNMKSEVQLQFEICRNSDWPRAVTPVAMSS